MALTKVDDRGLKTPIDLQDNEKVRLGTGNDLELYHDGTNSIIKNTQGQTRLVQDYFAVRNNADNEYMIYGQVDNTVQLYYDGSLKFETTSTGVSVTGKATFPDGNTNGVVIGNSSDIKLFHNGSHSYLENSTGNFILDNSTGADMYLNSGNDIYIRPQGSENGIKVIGDGAVELYHNNVKRFETDTDGVKVVAPEGAQAMLRLIGDEGDDDNDYFRLNAGGGTLKLQDASNGSSWEDNIVINGAGSVELYHDNNLRYFTRSNGGTVQGATSNVSLDFRTDTTHRGSVYASSGNSIGFLDSGGDWAIKHTNDDSTKFYVQTNQKATIDADGLKFGTDSASANALDDYEEGTWTPTDSSGASLSLTNNYTATYTKIGRLVHLQFDVSYPSTGDTNDAQLGNLPFNQANEYGSGVIGWTNLDNRGVYCHVGGGNQIYLMDNTSSGSSGTAHLDNNEASGKRFIGNATYFAAT